MLFGISISYLIVGTMTLLQHRTPPNLMGRVGSAFNFVTTVPQTAAIAAGAGLIALVPYQVLLAAMAALDLLAAGYLMRTNLPRGTDHAGRTWPRTY